MIKSLVLAVALGAACLNAYAQGSAKARVILDTDAYNEIDDQFFLAYSLFQERFDIEAITAAHYRWEQGSVDESYYEILRVLEIMGIKPQFPVVRGSDVAMPDEKTPKRSAATDLIRRLALSPTDKRPLYILAVGALTNVGSAIVAHPEIKDRIKVIWLGGFPPDGNMREFNAFNDRASVKAVFESGVDLTVVPTETSARYLTLPYAEAEQRLRHTNALGRMLLTILRDYGERDGKVIWDISVPAYMLQVLGGPKFFEVTTELAPVIDLKTYTYIRGRGPHTIKVCGKPDRAAVFAELFRHIPAPNDTDAPYFLSALATGDGADMRVLFSEPIRKPEAKCFEGQPQQIAGDGASFKLTYSSRPTEIRGTCIQDTAGNPLYAGRSSVPVRFEKGAAPGLKLTVFSANRGAKSIPEKQGQPIFTGTIPSLDWPGAAFPAGARPKEGATLMVAEGQLYIPLDHRYEFELHAGGLARVWLGGELLLDQSREGDRRARRTTFRNAGIYDLRVEYYGQSATPRMTLLWSLPFHDMSLIPDAVLLHRP